MPQMRGFQTIRAFVPLGTVSHQPLNLTNNLKAVIPIELLFIAPRGIVNHEKENEEAI
jgi:hypothetical protein